MDAIPQRPQLLLARVVIPVGSGFHAADERPTVVEVDVGEEGAHLLGADDAQGMEERGNAHPAAAVDAHGDGFRQVAPASVVMGPGGQLDASATAGRDSPLVVPIFQLPTLGAGRILGQLALVIDPGGSLELTDQDPFGAVDDEGARFGHHRHVAEEDVGLGDFAGFLVAQLGLDVQRLRIGNLAFPTLLRGVGRVVKPVVQEVELEALGPSRRFAVGETPGNSGDDWRTIAEGFRQAIGLEPVKGFNLAADQVRYVKGVRDVGIGIRLDIAGGQPAIVSA